MPSIYAIAVQGNTILRRTSNTTPTPTEKPISVIDLLIAFMVLVFISLLLGGALYSLHRLRCARLQAEQLPLYEDIVPSKSNPAHRRLTITATPYGRGSSVYIYNEKIGGLGNSSSPPLTPDSVPEIRITFPDEQDEFGKKKSGRVVVVRVGENGVGLEPVNEEGLPAYEKETGQRLHSIDMDRIGGLKEKSSWS